MEPVELRDDESDPREIVVRGNGQMEMQEKRGSFLSCAAAPHLIKNLQSPDQVTQHGCFTRQHRLDNPTKKKEKLL